MVGVARLDQIAGSRHFSIFSFFFPEHVVDGISMYYYYLLLTVSLSRVVSHFVVSSTLLVTSKTNISENRKRPRFRLQ